MAIMDEGQSNDLLRRALIDEADAAAVALRVHPLALCDALTVIFHGRRDLGTIQTYIAHGGLGAGMAVAPSALLRVPVDLDLGDAVDREEAEALYAAQAQALRDAIVAADTVLAVWREPLQEAVGARITIDTSIESQVSLPAHRLMPVSLAAPDRQITVAPVCSARTLVEGRPPMGIACVAPDVAWIYPLADDPETCLDDFLARAATHAHETAQRLEHQETSIRLFMELNEERPE
ncbi:MAG: hypothetical protein JWP17_3578 [Solirubrobacterales bacterium]|nr:hypothetical protein [Solirubrobacterales bacterium]